MVDGRWPMQIADGRWVMGGYMLSAIGYQLSTEPSEGFTSGALADLSPRI